MSVRKRSWTDSSRRERKTVQDDKIGAFFGILLYMGVFLMARNVDYWNHDSKRAVHNLIVNCMSRPRWQQFKRLFENFQSLRG
jgi:hypothetical protein